MDYERLFLDNLRLIDDVVRVTSRRHHLSTDQADELRSGVCLKIVDRDYEVLRKFQGRSSLRTYLICVVERHFLDLRNGLWGKWRPSAVAKRLGPVAVLLDQCLTRDRLSFDDAVEKLCTNHRVTLTRETLRTMSAHLPARTHRRLVGEDELAAIPAVADTEDSILTAIEREQGTDRVAEALKAALAQLDPQDRLILKMRFQDNLQVSQISRLLGLEQKPIYGRQKHIMDVLKRELTTRGVSRQQIEAMIGDPAAQLTGVIGAAAMPGNAPQGPS